jgi:hypothetical protein
MQWKWRLLWYAPGLLATVLAGCGPGNGLILGRVQGKVRYKGEPVKYGTVSFVPDVSKGSDGPIAMGNIKDDGTYTLSTSDPGDGAVVGHHKVSIVGLDPAPLTKADEKPMPSPAESPLEVMKARGKAMEQARQRPSRKAAATSKADGDTFTDRGGRVYRYVVPKKLGVPEESGLEVNVARGSNSIDFDIDESGNVHINP